MLKSRRLRLIAVLAALYSGSAYSVTLGDAQVKSFLNQPLNAEIRLVGLAPGQHQDLRLRIANEDQFERLGIDYHHFLRQLRFDVVELSGRWVVRVRSQRPVTEPFLDFPLQLNWLGGQFIKQYTFLIDPVRPVRAATVSRTRAATPPSPTRRTPADAASSAPATPYSGDNYGPVRRGETLWPIAKRVRPAGITTQQMAVALLRANPRAFIDGNINRLKAGANLTIPPLEVIQELDAAGARTEFNALAKGRKSTVATSPRETLVPSQPALAEAAPEPVAEVVPEPPQPVEEAQPKLRILSEKKFTESDDDTNSETALKEQLLVQMEKIESNRIATGEVQSRLTRLEEELSRMQQLVDLKNEQIAALESELAAREETPSQAEKPKAEALGPEDIPGQSSVAPTELVKIDPVPAPITPSVDQPRDIYEEYLDKYLWMVWPALGALGLLVLTLLMLRRRPEQDEDEAADLPNAAVAAAAAPATYSVVEGEEPDADDIEQAERDFENLAELAIAEADKIEEPQEALPELNISEVTQIENEMHEGLTNSLLDEMIEKQEELDRQRDAVNSVDTLENTQFSDEDIASWVEELGTDPAQEATTTEATADDDLPEDSDLPSILTEIDEELVTNTDAPLDAPANDIQLDPVDEPDQALVEDDAFSMSLDLARAYLEIGDQDGAKDMLKQALVGARDPDHRRQIEELLAQID